MKYRELKSLAVAAWEMGISKPRLYQLVKGGEIRVEEIGGIKYIQDEEIVKWIRKRLAEEEKRRKKQFDRLPRAVKQLLRKKNED
jgi:hypothetical protein